MPDSRWLFSYISRYLALSWPILTGAGAMGAAAAALAAAGVFGFDDCFAKAPDVETARIAKPTRIAFFIISPPLAWKRTAPGGGAIPPLLPQQQAVLAS